MNKHNKRYALAAALLLCLALAGGGYLIWNQNHPAVQVASPFEQLERAQDQTPFRLRDRTQLDASGQAFECSFSQGKNRIQARVACGPDGWAAYYRVLSLDPDLSLGRYAGPSFAESEFQDYLLLEPADPKQAPVSSLTYWNQGQPVATAAPYRYLMAKDPAQGWIAFYESLSPAQALALLEQEAPLNRN